MSALVVRANANRLPLADATVDLVVTSPPYFGLRSYQDGGEHYTGQVGDEAAPAEFIDALLAVTAECVRVLKPSGSIWVNLGDKYAQPGKGERNGQGIGGSVVHKVGAAQANRSAVGMDYGGMRGKSLMGLPWRYALGCIDQLGLILRAEVIWSKPNALPESVTDRVRRAHETWFHFTKEPRYFSAVDELREAHTSFAGFRGHAKVYGKAQRQDDGRNNIPKADQALGKLPGSVWVVPTEPLSVPVHLGVDHFAAFPTEWPRRIVQGWSPSGICVECGEGRTPVAEVTGHTKTGGGGLSSQAAAEAARGGGRQEFTASKLGWAPTRQITGESCACQIPDAPTRPAVVLDCFGGTGTTALVASTLGRIGISCDLSHDYSRLARWRTTDPAERAKAMRVDKPPVEVDGQADLFGDVA